MTKPEDAPMQDKIIAALHRFSWPLLHGDIVRHAECTQEELSPVLREMIADQKVIMVEHWGQLRYGLPVQMGTENSLTLFQLVEQRNALLAVCHELELFEGRWQMKCEHKEEWCVTEVLKAELVHSFSRGELVHYPLNPNIDSEFEFQCFACGLAKRYLPSTAPKWMHWHLERVGIVVPKKRDKKFTL